MVVKFKTCHQTWGRIAASSAASPAASNANTQCPMVPVEIEGSTLMVPRINIIGHFSEDIALDVLQSVGRDSVRALRQLSDPVFCYNPLTHWPAEALAKLPQLQKGLQDECALRKLAHGNPFLMDRPVQRSTLLLSANTGRKSLTALQRQPWSLCCGARCRIRPKLMLRMAVVVSQSQGARCKQEFDPN
eukprot:TRINITY_DN2665_c0_g1_i8.p1 TRINITY_DN2665_c0_g1~~TRINITY_DN2665_c0_g1_i8.p1  ORF type:complete len:189 (+),score=15.26 TRINITY_DN2665_c0_g1_i8:623-1189(+)